MSSCHACPLPFRTNPFDCIGEISCRDSEAGADYIGGVGQTTTAHACKVWKDVKIPTSYAYKEYGRIEMPDGSLSNADCRNPVGRRLRPWCHSTNPDLEGEDAWEYCDVPLCGKYDELWLVQQKGGVQYSHRVSVLWCLLWLSHSLILF